MAKYELAASSMQAVYWPFAVETFYRNGSARAAQRPSANTAALSFRPVCPPSLSIETMGGLSTSAQQLLREIHHTASTRSTWCDVDTVGNHLVDSIDVAVQCCSGMAVRASMDRGGGGRWVSRRKMWRGKRGCACGSGVVECWVDVSVFVTRDHHR